ncbi:phosphate transporter [Ephemerocybe angulata]|uniref:Phosphate transporter n=1 Tax=Ephemerocybe angulata TaxID=980116 RepID=A0A8H6HLR8_9AGAR|nr:phosphate transporter [Tulosesus angulatus]
MADAEIPKPYREKMARSRLEEDERESTGQPWMLTGTEAKLLGIAGVGFFLDAYDLFIINPVTTMLQYRLYGGNHLPANLEGFVKAGANIGSVIGQFGFGYAADALGRKKVYGKELMLIIFATVMTLTTPTGQLTPDHALIYLGIWRIILGIGVGGDYPMSASVTSDRANIRKRGTMLTYIFSMQGWGSFMGSLMTIIVLAIYRHTIETDGHISKVDGVWRIVVGLSLIPAFSTLYQRLTLGESARYEASKKLVDHEHAGASGTSSIDEDLKLKDLQKVTEAKDGNDVGEKREDGDEEDVAPELLVKKPAHFKDFYRHFRQWRNAKMLIGTSLSWFLLDIAFYGINLNQNVVLQQIGFDGKTGTEWNRLFKVSTGNMIITALGFVPGYYATLFTIEILGRKKIQLMGFLMAALFLGILAGMFHRLSKAEFIVCFALLQFFFNFGANTTTYCYPAEVFPTRYKAFAHGISAASGKVGAIISALAFNTLSKSIGTPNILWIFFGCCLLGACTTLLLPEVKGRDPDVILAQQIAEERAERIRRTGRSRE